MEQYQFLLAAVLIVGVVSYIVASSQTRIATRAKPVFPPTQPESVQLRPIPRPPPVSPQPRRPRAPPSRSTSAPTPQTAQPSPVGAAVHAATMAEQQAYRALLAKAHGDRALVERLIAYEQKRERHGIRLTWIQNANARWERDNR